MNKPAFARLQLLLVIMSRISLHCSVIHLCVLCDSGYENNRGTGGQRLSITSNERRSRISREVGWNYATGYFSPILSQLKRQRGHK